MKEIAQGVWQLAGWPRDFINVYLVGDVLIDAGTRWAKWRIRRQLARRPIRLIALTHVHPDHQGSAHMLCEEYGVPLACHEADVPVMEGRSCMLPDNGLLRFAYRIWAGPPHPVSQVLQEGDEVAGFRIVHAPGHTPGQVIFFREADRVAIAGDVLANINFLTLKPGLLEPPAYFSADPAENRRSICKLADLGPAIVCFGHGPPLRDNETLDKFARRYRREA
jgi:glyoxylase-like metal-dependent hydrolase (beta-lactamase superfamily II)